MPAHSLADDVALCSTVITGLFRAAVAAGVLSRPGLADLSGPAAAAGISEAQARMFADGRVTLPPRQSMVLLAAVFEQLRAFDAARAESAAGHGPPGPETGPELVEAAGVALRREYPSWRIALPPGYEKLGGDQVVKLVWEARRDNVTLTGVSAAELGGKMALHEAHATGKAARHKAYMEG